MDKQIAIKLACAEYSYKWPSQLYSGVMFFYGYKITIKEFNDWAKQFK